MERRPISVQLVTAPGCSKCEQAKQAIISALDQQRGEYQIQIELTEVNLVDQPEIAAQHGIWATPALIIDGELAFQGRVNERELQAKLAAAAESRA